MRNVVNADVELYQNLLPLNGVMKHLVYVILFFFAMENYD